jgi:hypothetical protein
MQVLRLKLERPISEQSGARGNHCREFTNCPLMLLSDFGPKNPGSEHTLALYLAHHPDQIECFPHLV